MKKSGAVTGALFAASAVLLVASMYLVFVYVPTEATLGIVQRILYIMVPMGWLSMLSSTIIFIGSIGYLKTKQSKWDVLAYCAGKIGIVATLLTLIVGSLWARPSWLTWFPWGEPRVTSTLVLFFIYVAYFLVRAFATEESRGAAFAAVIGIVGFVDIPIIGMSTSLWRGMHPPLMVFEGGLPGSMLLTLIVSVLAFTALYAVLLLQTISIKNDEIEIRKLKEQIG